MNDILKKLEKLRQYKEENTKYILIYKLNKKAIDNENLIDSYFVGKNNKLVISLLNAKVYEDEMSAENNKKNDSMISAPYSLFVDNEIDNILKKIKK